MLALDGRLPATLTLDIDSLPVEVHGRQPGSRWNRYYKARIFHPLAASVARTGDLLDLRLREGDVHTAEGGLEYILEVVALARRFLCQNITVRFDAGFPGARLLAGRYRKRGKAEGHFGEFMSVANPSLPSSPRPKSHYRGKPVQAAARITGADAFARNQVRLLVAAAGYQIMHCLRKFLERATRRGWSLRALPERVLRAPARFAVSERRVTMVLITVAPRWETIFRKLSGLSDLSPRPRRSRH